MATKQELFRTIWNTANILRNSVDGWDFKQYMLGMLFYYYVSDNITSYVNKLQHDADPDADFDYANISDSDAEQVRPSLVGEKGYFLPPSLLFSNVLKNALKSNQEELNVVLRDAFNAIENSADGTDSESDLKHLFDDLDLNSRKLGNSTIKRNETLIGIMQAVAQLGGNISDNKIDLLGDAYEYLMTMYASNAGRSGGEFFTPQEVSQLLARIVIANRPTVDRVYDPACGSGSLLLQFKKYFDQKYNDGISHVTTGFFGQEINITTYNLCRMNMFLHDVPFNKFDIQNGDTLLEPRHTNKEPFDAIVSNPPYSIKWPGKSNPVLINDARFAPAGVLAPQSRADLAFTMHMLAWLSNTGTAAIVEFPGVLYRGSAEQKIRKYLVDNNYIDTVIQLPPNLFFGVSIATCIIVLRKNKPDARTLFIDASNLFIHEGDKNKLSPQNIDTILSHQQNRIITPHLSALIKNDDIAANDYNLSVSSYVAPPDNTPSVDIQQLNNQIQQIVERENSLRSQIDTIIADLEADHIL